MRVCIVAEGCYPFVVGGVSSWTEPLLLQVCQNTVCITCESYRSYISRASFENFIYCS